MTKEANGRDPFRWRSTFALFLIAIVVLVVLREFRIALGVGLGFAFFAGNLLLMMEIGQALLRRDEGDRAKPKLWAAISSSARLLFLAGALSLIAIYLGREAVLAACGGFFVAQVNLHIPALARRREG